MTISIDTLKKVKLAILLEEAPQKNPPVMFDMIYGLGSLGLSAFELSLAGKMIGEMVRLKVTTSQAEEFFGSFFSSIRIALGLHIIPAEMTFVIEVKDIQDAENKEVVKALATAGGHGCGGGSCDCGCG